MPAATRTSQLILFTGAAFLALAMPGLAGEAEGVVVIRVGSAELSGAIPYRTGKVPVVFVHGMLGSPANWSAMIEHLSADPAFRERFQPLVFHYDSLQPILDSGLRLLEVLREARRQFELEGRDGAFDRVVVVGHSMGGLVAKAAVVAHGSRPKGSGEIATALPRIGRVIFVATPHRGSPVDRGAIRTAGSWVARVVSPSSPAWGSRATCVDQLALDHPLLAELDRARAVQGVPVHSIIASLGDPSDGGATDGLVPVASAVFMARRSEVVVRASHLCFRNPEVIREVRRILVEETNSPSRNSRDGSAVNQALLTAPKNAGT